MIIVVVVAILMWTTPIDNDTTDDGIVADITVPCYTDKNEKEDDYYETGSVVD